MRTILAHIFLFALFITPLQLHAADVKISDLEFIDYTLGSLANPHVIRIGEPQAHGGRVAALERIYDVSGVAKLKQTELKRADALFKKHGADIPEHELVSLMTAERTLFAARKYKQRLHVWDAQKPKNHFVVEIPPVFNTEEPMIINPEWSLTSTNIVLSQESGDRATTKFFTIDFKTKKLRAAPKLNSLPPVYGIGADFSLDDSGERINHTIFEERNDDGTYYVGEFIITNARTQAQSMIKYSWFDFVLDEEGEPTTILNPLILELGSAGFYVKGYTKGALLTRQGIMSPENVMDNTMPMDLTLAAHRAEITRKWNAVPELDFATYQVIAYRLHK